MGDQLSRDDSAGKHDFSGDFTREVIGAFWRAYYGMSRNLLESAYAGAMEVELRGLGLNYSREAPVVVRYQDEVVGHYRADFIVEGRLILELKVTPQCGDAERRQLVHYLRATCKPIGLLLNFGPKPQVLRVVNGS